jgi:glycosyltransferase involved in cell wall biosynthesis
VRTVSSTAPRTVRAVRVLLVDPAAYTLPYDHHLAEALAARGIDVELIASRFRFGDAPVPSAYLRTDLFYPMSSRLFRRSRLRLPLKAVEHPLGVLRLRGRPHDVLHVQWAPLPQVDARLLPTHRPSVITAHDVLPRRTASRRELWRRLYGRFLRVVVHSERGRDRLVDELGIEHDRIAVIPHPVFPGSFRYEGGEPTLLFLGVIQPYKQLDQAIALARAVGARLLVVGDPAYDLGERVSLPDVEWRLGYRSNAELDDALAEATVAVFPYREELDQSGALLRALGAGVPAAAYDVGGIAEPVRRFGAGTVAPPDDIDALAEGVRRLLDDPEALQRARAGARRAAAELTFDASAAVHISLYRELLG